MNSGGDRVSSAPVGDEPIPVLRRRGLLRGGALLAGTAGAAALVAAAPTPARAADGDPVELGAENASTGATTIAINGAAGSADPTLILLNGGGPSLELDVLAEDVDWGLELGQLADTELGPIVGVTHPDFGLTTTYLATGIDLDDLPTPYALPTPSRLLDTRSSTGRESVLRTSSAAYDSEHRLKAGAWLDIQVAVESATFEIPAAWINLTAATPTANGYLTAYPPGDFPGTSTLNFQAKQSLANAAFVATGIVAGRFAIRVRTSTTTHVVVDLTGVTIKGNSAHSRRRGQGHSEGRVVEGEEHGFKDVADPPAAVHADRAGAQQPGPLSYCGRTERDLRPDNGWRAPSRWWPLRAILVGALVAAAYVVVPAAAPGLLTRARADGDQPVSGAFNLGGGLAGAVDERTGQFSVSLPLVSVASRGDSDVSFSLSWVQSRAGNGVDRLGWGEGWSLGSAFIDTSGGVTVYPASGGAYQQDTDGQFASGLENYTLHDLRSVRPRPTPAAGCDPTGTPPTGCITTTQLCARPPAVPDPVPYSYTINYDDGKTDFFDANGNLVARTDRYGSRTDLQYRQVGQTPDGDQEWQPTAIVDAYGQVTTFSYGPSSMTVTSPKRSDGTTPATVVTSSTTTVVCTRSPTRWVG